MANQNKSQDKLWIRVMCFSLAALMVGGIVFMLIQMLLG